MEEKNNLKEQVQEEQDEINKRINALYNGNTKDGKFRTNEMSPEERQKVRKTMLILLFITIITAFCAIILMINPFESFNKNNNIQTPSNNKKDELPIGEISISNETVKELNRTVELSLVDLYYADTFVFFEKESVTSSELPDELKMSLIEKSYEFVNLLTDKGLMEYIETCSEEGLQISKEDFDKVVTKVLGPNVNITSDLNKTMHYTQSIDISNLLFSKKDDYYLITCAGKIRDVNLNKYPSMTLTKAVNTDIGIELYYNVIFIDDTKVYKDYAMTELISNDKYSDYNAYVEQGSVYKYIFNLEGAKDYYLSKIELVK